MKQVPCNNDTWSQKEPITIQDCFFYLFWATFFWYVEFRSVFKVFEWLISPIPLNMYWLALFLMYFPCDLVPRQWKTTSTRLIYMMLFWTWFLKSGFKKSSSWSCFFGFISWAAFLKYWIIFYFLLIILLQLTSTCLAWTTILNSLFQTFGNHHVFYQTVRLKCTQPYGSSKGTGWACKFCISIRHLKNQKNY